MTWTRGVLAVLVVAGVAFVATRPDDEAKYLGDFPSMFEASEQPPAGPANPPVRQSVSTGSDVVPPAVSGPEAPAGGPGYTGGVRGDAGPGADTARRYSPPGFEGDDIGPAPGDADYQPIPRPPLCPDDFFQPGVGLISCLTGQILEPDLPVDVPVVTGP